MRCPLPDLPAPPSPQAVRWRILAFLCLISVVTGCGWLSRPAGDPRRESNFQDGLRWMDQGRWVNARESFYRALEVNPQNLHAHLSLGDIYQTRLTNQVLALYHYHRYLEVGRLQNGGSYHDQSASDGIRSAEVDLARRYAERMFRDQQQFELDNLRRTNAFLLQRVDVLNHHIAILSRQLASQSNVVVPIPQPSQPSQPPTSNPRTVVTNAEPPRITRSQTPIATGIPRTNAPVTSSTSTTTPTAAPRVHKVQSGESLAAIARRYNVRLDALQAANPGVDSRRLKVGQSIVIPTR